MFYILSHVRELQQNVTSLESYGKPVIKLRFIYWEGSARLKIEEFALTMCKMNWEAQLPTHASDP